MFRRAVVQVQRRFPRRGIEEFWSQGDPQLRTGRSWYASELRKKSFEDLHKLWFVLLKEKNLLESERLLARQTGVKWDKPGRLQKVKKSMARLKTVVHLRSLEHKAKLAGATANALETTNISELTATPTLTPLSDKGADLPITEDTNKAQ